MSYSSRVIKSLSDLVQSLQQYNASKDDAKDIAKALILAQEQAKLQTDQMLLQNAITTNQELVQSSLTDISAISMSDQGEFSSADYDKMVESTPFFALRPNRRIRKSATSYMDAFDAADATNLNYYSNLEAKAALMGSDNVVVEKTKSLIDGQINQLENLSATLKDTKNNVGFVQDDRYDNLISRVDTKLQQKIEYRKRLD
jgi:hypothetical protein|tara:strand:+ start:467 stop:1069 length:603 start_codon:yes stop_codon:yes gene_type:complete